MGGQVKKLPTEDCPAFDRHAATYNQGHQQAVKASGYHPDYFHEYKVRVAAETLRERGIVENGLKVLNFGCGIGNSDPWLGRYLPGAEVFSTDISPASLAVAREANRHLPRLTYAQYDGESIPFDQTFDVVFVAHVFHHIPRKLHHKTLSLLRASMKPGGLLFIFEHNPLNPMTLWVAYFNDYKLDENTNLLSPWYAYRLLRSEGFQRRKLNFSIFFPSPLAGLVPYERHLSKVPLGAHFYLIAEA